LFFPAHSTILAAIQLFCGSQYLSVNHILNLGFPVGVAVGLGVGLGVAVGLGVGAGVGVGVGGADLVR